MKRVANIVLNDFTNDSRVWKITKSLASFSYHATVVAIFNDGLEKNEHVAGVEVERIKLITRPWPKWKAVQIIKYLEFMFRAFFRYRKADIVHCNDLNALPISLLIKLLGRDVKVVYDCHEYETEVNGLKGFEKKMKKLLEWGLIRFADQVITVSDSISDEYVRLYAVNKPRVILNCSAYIGQIKSDILRENLGIRPDQKIFLYQGGLGKGRGIELLAEAFTRVSSDKNVLVYMGYGPLEETIKRKARETGTIFFHPAVPPDVLLNYTSSADYGVSFIEDVSLSDRYCLPNKIFEYLMAGLPILTSNLPEMKSLVERERVGIVATDNTIEGFADAIASLLEADYGTMKENVLKARQKYCWEQQEKVLREVYDEL